MAIPITTFTMFSNFMTGMYVIFGNDINMNTMNINFDELPVDSHAAHIHRRLNWYGDNILKQHHDDDVIGKLIVYLSPDINPFRAFEKFFSTDPEMEDLLENFIKNIA